MRFYFALRGYPNRHLGSPKTTIVPGDSCAGKLEHSQIILRLFGPANEQVAKSVDQEWVRSTTLPGRPQRRADRPDATERDTDGADALGAVLN